MPVTISTRIAPPAVGVSGEVDALFCVAMGATAAIPATPTLIRSIGDYEAAGGTRASDTLTYDGIDTYFREGGKRAFVVAKGAGTLAAALALFTENLGGGQLVAWQATPLVADYQALLDSAAATKRYALMDSKQADDTSAKLVTTGGTLPATTNTSYGATFGPWPEIPAPAGVAGGSARVAPPSASVAALIARSDGLGNPNRAPAGRDFPLQYATGLVGPLLSDTEATSIRNAGINPLREKFNLMVLDGFQTKIASSPDDPYWQANCGRGRMWLQWRATIIGLNYEYKPLDGRGRLAGALQGELEAMCKSLWDVDGLYGDRPQDAFHVETGVSVNNTGTVAVGELHAVVEVRFSLHAKTVVIELVSVPITGRVSG